MPDQAFAGREAKADLKVVMHKGGPPENEIVIQSSAMRLFGTRIREVVEQTLTTLGVQNTRVEVFDSAAFDWVIMARVETAAKRLYPELSTEALPAWACDPKPTGRDRMRRSRLYLPGNNPDLMLNAGLFGPDGVILDLEDSVAPAEKDAARILVRNALRAIDFGDAERMVRINPAPEGMKDLPAIIAQRPNMILLPKAEQSSDITETVNAISQITTRHKIQDPIWLMPILESATGVWHACEIGMASDHVAALAFGAEDFTRDVQAARTVEGKESFTARSMVVLGARAAGVQPIDTVFSDVEDEAGLLASVKEAISLGFEGKGCIHPRQIEVIHKAFRPTDEEIAHALKVKAAMEEAERSGSGVISLGSKMVDPPVVARALRVLRVAAEMGIDVSASAPEGGVIMAEMVKNAVGTTRSDRGQRQATGSLPGRRPVRTAGAQGRAPDSRLPPVRASTSGCRISRAAIQKVGLRDGMTVGMHHHMRNGDMVAVPFFDAVAELGIKDIVFMPSAAFPCHEPLIKQSRERGHPSHRGIDERADRQVRQRGPHAGPSACCVRTAAATRRFRTVKCTSTWGSSRRPRPT